MTEKLVTTYDQIAKELRNLKQWGLFKLKWVPERKKNTKIPFSAIDGNNAKSNDPGTWTTFDEAREALRLAMNKLPIKCKFVAKETVSNQEKKKNQ